MKISPERQEYCKNIAEIIDRLITVQLCSAGGGSHYTQKPVSPELYDAAREKIKDPLTYTAAMNLLDTIKPGDNVFIATGFIVAPWMRPEVDGPIGAASLARALSVCFNATPVIITENENIAIFKPVFEVTGLQIDTAKNSNALPRRIIFEPFPINEKFAMDQTTQLLDRFNPSAIITIEKPSYNEKKVYHNGHGMDVSNLVAKTDVLIEAAKKKGILTIGMGDGGNEIGMGLISDTVKSLIPTGKKCKCPCRAGIAAKTETDVLVVGSVANWGSYGVEACLAIATDTPKVLHDGCLERFILDASIRAGIVDPSTGLSEGYADGTHTEINVYLIEMLNKMIAYKNPTSWRQQASKSWKVDLDAVNRQIESYGKYLLEKDDHIFRN